MLREKATQMAAGYTKSIREVFDRTVVQGAGRNKAQTPSDSYRRSTPCRSPGRTFGAAAQTGSKAGLAGSCGSRVEDYVAGLRRYCRANRPTVNTGSFDANKKLAIKPRIPGEACTLIDLVLLYGGCVWHARNYTLPTRAN